MVSKFLRLAAFVCCAVVLTSFALFAIDQTNGGEARAEQEIQGVLHPVVPPEKPVGQPRKFIDQAAHDLTTPFNHIADKDDKWASHLVPTVLALLLFGLGLGFLARTVQAHE
jgi:hypothetical protein